MHRSSFNIASLRMSVVQKKKGGGTYFHEWIELQILFFFCMNNNIFKLLQKFRLVSVSPDFLSTPLTYALEKVLFYEYTPVVILFFLPIQIFIMVWTITYCLRYAHIITYIPTFIMVTFDTGTNFPAVSWNPLLAVAMVNTSLRCNGIAVPTQSHPNAASLTLSAWNILNVLQLMFCEPCSLRLNVLLTCARGLTCDIHDRGGFEIQ